MIDMSIDDAICEAVQLASDLVALRNLSARRPGLSGVNAAISATRARERTEALGRFLLAIERRASASMREAADAKE